MDGKLVCTECSSLESGVGIRLTHAEARKVAEALFRLPALPENYEAYKIVHDKLG